MGISSVGIATGDLKQRPDEFLQPRSREQSGGGATLP